MKIPAESKRKRHERKLAAMKNERSSFEAHWKELAEHMAPRRGRFTLGENKGEKRHQKIIDSVPLMAARTLASGMMAGLTSPARPWFQLTTPDPDLAEFGSVKQWLHVVTQRMRDILSKSNLYSSLPILYGELGTFGTGCMLGLDSQRSVIRFYSQTIGSYWLAQSNEHRVDSMYREIRYTVRQLVQEFGIDAVSDRARDMFARGHLEQTIDVGHAVEPNDERLMHRMDAAGMEYRSCYWELGCRDDRLLAERGFRESPIMAPRWSILGEDIYGSSPGMDALGDCKALQLQQRRKAQAVDKMIDPPLVGPTALKNKPVSLLPGDVTYVDSNGQYSSLRSIYDVRLDPSMLVEDIRAMEDRINSAFYADLFLMLAMSDRREITAREIEERHEEKLLMLGPVLERLNDELLDPIIDRTFGLMLRAGSVPPPPPELEGVDLKVEYISILAQAQKAVGLGGIDRLLGTVSGIAAVKPEVLDKVDFDQAIDEYGHMLGVPPRLILPDDRVIEIRKGREQQARMAQAAAMAQPAAQGASAVKSLADAKVEPGSALDGIIGAASGAQA